VEDVMANRVQCIRGVGSKGGYSYYAWGVYEPAARKQDGVFTWRLVKSGVWFTSDKRQRHAFDDIPIVHNVRYGTVCPREMQNKCVMDRISVV
jgi:hypothetical protein